VTHESIEPNELEKQLHDRRQDVFTDSYMMSIGELTNLYRDGELNVHPDFQRFFRWKELQKSRFIESILLGIPLPSIFVAQDTDGRWELVDGLQRVNTLLELQGLLKDENGELLPPLRLVSTTFLPALEGKVWDSKAGPSALTQAQQLDIKRSKFDIKIVKRTSATYAKYELFRRLNSYGSSLTAQELRSCLLISVDPRFQRWLEELGSYPPFRRVTSLPDRLQEERFDLELVLRFLVLHNYQDLTLGKLRLLSDFLDDEAVSMAETMVADDLQRLEKVFYKTFSIIEANGGEDVFRKWDGRRFVGPFLNSCFEVIAMGIGYQLAQGRECRIDLEDVAHTIWSTEGQEARRTSGRSAEARILKSVPYGRKLLRQDSGTLF
jgi:hypothetical protein